MTISREIWYTACFHAQFPDIKSLYWWFSLCRFLPLSHLGPHNILGSNIVAPLQDPLAYRRWALRTFIIYILSYRQVFGPWHIVAYYLAPKLALLSFSSFASATLSSQVLGCLRCPPIWDKGALQPGYWTFFRRCLFIVEHGFYHMNLCCHSISFSRTNDR